MNSSQAMKPCALVLLVALLCAETAQGLRCYQCQNYTHTKSCEQVTCSYPEGDGICTSLEGNIAMGSETVRLVNKLCLPVCPKKSDFSVTSDALTINFRITCCKKDLCNVGVLVGGNAWTLVWGLLFRVGLGFLWALL